MRIALVTPDFPPCPGGIGDQSAALAQALRQCGCEVAVFTRGEASPSTSVDGVFASLDWGIGGMSGLARRIGVWQPDTVIVQYEPHMYHRRGLSVTAARLIWALRRLGLPVVVAAHELYYAWDEGLRHWPVSCVQRLIALLIMRWSTAVVFTVPCRLEIARRTWPRPRARLHAIANGPNIIPSRARDRADARKHLGLPIDGLIVVSWGSNHPSFQREHLSTALSQLECDGVPVLFAVGGEMNPLPGAFRHLGYCEREVVSDWLCAADFAILPWCDGASTRRTTLINALAHGLPVLSTDGSQTEAALRDSGALRLVPPDRPDLMAAAATSLACDASARARAADAADRLFRTRLDWTLLIRQWMAVLSQACSPHA